MSVLPKALIARQQIPSSITSVYVSTGATSIIDKATVTNTGAFNTSLDIYVNTPSGVGTTSQVHMLIGKVIAVDECYLLPELTSRIMAAGSGLAMVASSASSLTLALSGRQTS